MKVFHLPIESYNNRYTADWVRQFEYEFTQQGAEFVTIGDSELRTIDEGSVLDAAGTHIYKFIQMMSLMTMIKAKQVQDGDVIFFADLWFPGIESLFYVRDITGIKFKIAGVFHAGTWDPHDFTCRNGMRGWAQHVELGWLHGLDMIFVATQFHKDLIVFNSGSFDPNKIHVTGIPFYAAALKQAYPIPVEQKENIVVFPHRTDIEKHPEKFDKLAKKFPQWKFVKTINTTKSREEYFQLLAKSKVMISFAEQETFGYSTVEAMALGNYVIVPDALSYRETVPKSFRYSNEKEIPALLEKLMGYSAPAFYPELDKWALSIKNMIVIMKG